MMKRLIALFFLAALSLTPVSAWAQTVKKPFCGHCLHEWNFAAKKDRVSGWCIGAARLDAKDERNLVRYRNEIPCMINAIPWDADKKKPQQGVDIYTKEKYGDCTVKLEVLVPKGSNSGIYLMGEYEVQVCDSFGIPGNKISDVDMGAIYKASAPKTNACLKPGDWQRFEIEFVAPKFDAKGKKTANAVFKKVVLNGRLIQENVEVGKPTGGGLTMKEAPTGPLMFQGDHGPVALRNIEVVVP